MTQGAKGTGPHGKGKPGPKIRRRPTPPLTRATRDKPAPQGANTVLQAISDITEEINKQQVLLEECYRDRDAMYLEAQDIGATVPQIAKAAGLSLSGVKYMLAKAKK